MVPTIAVGHGADNCCWAESLQAAAAAAAAALAAAGDSSMQALEGILDSVEVRHDSVDKRVTHVRRGESDLERQRLGDIADGILDAYGQLNSQRPSTDIAFDFWSGEFENGLDIREA